MVQTGRQRHLSEPSLAGECKITNGGHDSAINFFRNCNISAVTGVGPNLYGAVVQNNVSIGNTIFLVDPLGVKGHFAVELIFVIVIFLSEGIVIVPTVEHSIQPFRLRKLLQGMTLNENTLFILQFIGQHIVDDGATLFQNECADIQCAEAIIPVMAQVTQVITRSIKHFCYIFKGNIGIVLQKQGNGTSNNRRCQRCTIHSAILPAHKRSVYVSGRYQIRIFAIVGILRQGPAVAQGTNTNNLFVRCGPAQGRGGLITGCGYTDNIAVIGQLGCFCERIDKPICTKGHIHHIHIPLDGIIQAKNQVRGALKITSGIALSFDHNNIDIGRNTHDTIAIHRRSKYAGHGGAVALLIFNE